MILILLTWTGYISIFMGIGLFTLKVFKLQPDYTISKWFIFFWMGWSASIAILQVWHFFLKVDIFILALLAVISLCGWTLNWKDIKPHFSRTPKKLVGGYILLNVIVGVWVASVCTTSTVPHDTGLYHLQAVMWNKTYPVVPGLGNLHTRLAFNNSSFLYNALLDQGIWAEKGYFISNGLLMYAFLMQIAIHFIKLIQSKFFNKLDFYFILMLAPSIGWMYGTPATYQITGYSPDIIIFILGAVVCGLVLELVLSNDGKALDQFSFFCIAMIGFCGITVKISFFPIVFMTQLFSIYLWNKRYAKTLKLFITAYMLPVILILSWIGRGIILSGYLAFPFAELSVPVEWKVPYQIAQKTQNGIEDWGKTLGKDQPTESWKWLVPWATKFDDNLIRAGVFSVVVFSISILLHLLSKWKMKGEIFLFLFIPSVSLLFWFFTSPLPRFAGASFWILAAGTALLLIDQVGEHTFGKYNGVYAMTIFLLFLSSNLDSIHSSIYPLIRMELESPMAEMVASMEKYQTIFNDGIAIHYPVETHQCWLTPIPCMIKENPQVFLIKPPDLSKGFITR